MEYNFFGQSWVPFTCIFCRGALDLWWCTHCLCFLLADPYSVAGSDGSISASVASIQPQASSSSAPSSPASRHSVSTLKKWLTNPVRKLSGGGLPRGERPLRKTEGRTRRHGRQEDRKSIDLDLLSQAEAPFAVPQESVGTVRAKKCMPVQTEAILFSPSLQNRIRQSPTLIE